MNDATNFKKNIRLFQERLKALRGGKSLQEVATELGISRATLGYYESGDRKPDIEMLLRIADYYNVSCDYLLGLTEISTPDTDDRSISEKTGLDEYSITFLRRTKSYIDASPANNSEVIYLNAVNALIKYNLLIEDIAHYLYFHFDYAYDDSSEGELFPSSSITFVDKRINRRIEINSDYVADFFMSKIHNSLKKLREDYWGKDENNNLPFVSWGRLSEEEWEERRKEMDDYRKRNK